MTEETMMANEDEIRKLFPDCGGEHFSAPSYDEVVASFGFKVLVEVTDADYQGDSRILLSDGERRGLLIFGWGSCSGCDSLQACANYADLAELRDELIAKIEWESSAADMATKIEGKDWSGSFLSGEENKQFVKEAMAILS